MHIPRTLVAKEVPKYHGSIPGHAILSSVPPLKSALQQPQAESNGYHFFKMQELGQQVSDATAGAIPSAERGGDGVTDSEPVSCTVRESRKKRWIPQVLVFQSVCFYIFSLGGSNVISLVFALCLSAHFPQKSQF